jgi:hypothetical protein
VESALAARTTDQRVGGKTWGGALDVTVSLILVPFSVTYRSEF